MKLILVILTVALPCSAIAIAIWFDTNSHDTPVTLDTVADAGYWEQRIRAVDAQDAYEEMVTIALKYHLTDRHLISHTFGAALYNTKGVVSLPTCDPRATYGCAHEVIKRYIDSFGVGDLSGLAAACDSMKSKSPFLCKHGIGHGLLLYNGRTLEGLRTSLTQCDAVTSPNNFENCHSGAFMEYDYDMTKPGDHTAPRPLEESNYFSPCNDVEAPYYLQCIRRRPYWWLLALPIPTIEEKFTTMMKLCTRLSDDAAREACITGIGHQTVFMYDTDANARYALCKSASQSPEEAAICSTGADRAYNALYE